VRDIALYACMCLDVDHAHHARRLEQLGAPINGKTIPINRLQKRVTMNILLWQRVPVSVAG
jgi:hypothetical protein